LTFVLVFIGLPSPLQKSHLRYNDRRRVTGLDASAYRLSYTSGDQKENVTRIFPDWKTAPPLPLSQPANIPSA
jgi:hypothetical protein